MEPGPKHMLVIISLAKWVCVRLLKEVWNHIYRFFLGLNKQMNTVNERF